MGDVWTKIRQVPPTARALDGGAWLITVPNLPPSLNEWQRMHWTKRYQETKELCLSIWGLAQQNRIPRFEHAECACRYFFPIARVRDSPNYHYWKSLWDALVRAGILRADDIRHLHVSEPALLVDRERPRSEITIHPVPPPAE